MVQVRRRPSFWLLALMLSTLFLASSVAAQEQDAQYEAGSVVRIVLIDGGVHVGTVLSRGETTIELEGSGGVRVSIPRDQIRRIEPLDGRRFHSGDPNRSRLFFGPTARPLGHGVGYVAVYELFFPFVAVGLRDFMTLAGGVSIIPGVGTQALYFAPKATLLDQRNLDVAIGGIIGSTTSLEDAGGLLFGIGTFGGSEAAITVGAGFGFVDGEFSTRPILLLAGEYQIANSIKLLSENYVIPGYGDAILASGGIRFFGSRIAADIGLLTMPTLLGEGGFPFFPWLGFAYTFGSI